MAITYNVYGNDGAGGPIDYGTPVATGVTATLWATPALAYPGDHRFAVRAEEGGLEESNIDAVVRIVLDAAGVDVTNRPAAPINLAARTAKAGVIRVTWARPATGERANYYRIYLTAAPGPIDWDNDDIVVVGGNADRGGAFSADLSGLVDGTTYLIGVRAVNVTADDGNTTTVSAVSDATGPDPVEDLAISTDPADWS